ncbi:hypothetical protein PQR39_25775 [Paraburkholderia sediminicola]|uniref:hypothetical protein n=1 Tax=Paraburkholderia sediminicola TaxID=458836 RepID=UPI0038BB5AB5
MNKNSSILTGSVTLTASSLVPLVQWVSMGFPMPMPFEVQLIFASAIVTGIHALSNRAIARAAAE